MLGKTIDKHVDQIFKAGKDIKALCERLLRIEELLAPIASFIQKQIMDAIADKRSVDLFQSTAIPYSASADTAVAAEPSRVLETPARPSSECSSEGSHKSRKSGQARQLAINIAVPCAKCETKSLASRTLHCQCVTRTPAEKPDAIVK